MAGRIMFRLPVQTRTTLPEVRGRGQRSDGASVRLLPSWVPVVHMFNHGTHHRGQLTTLLKQIGLDPGETDIHKVPGLARVG